MIHSIRQVFAGTKEIDEKLKYQAISLMIGSVHLMFVLFFWTYHLTFLMTYNICIVLFYLTMVAMIAKKGASAWVFICIYLEILSHGVIATLLMGWDFGFINYNIPLIPMSFYMSYTIPTLKRRMLSIPLIASLVVLVGYFLTNGICFINGPVYKDVVPEHVMHIVFMLNMLAIFMFLCTVALLFSLEIRFMQRHLEEENISLSRMANFDALTHLMNRRSMNIQLKQVLDETEIMGEDFCLIMADIDDFKKVNDTYGHSKGDEVLVEVARVLQSNVREQDKVCRWGGEEMLILLRSNMDIAKGVAQRICSDMSQTKIENGENPIYVTLTLGVSAYEKGITIRNMIETADQRMYRGKRSGKNCVVWN